MKRNRIIISVAIVLALFMLSACSVSKQTDEFAWVESIKNFGDCQTIKFEQTVENGELLLSSCTQNFTKDTEGWTFEKTEKVLNEDAYATEKYTTETTSGTVEQAPYLRLDKSMIEKFKKENASGQDVYGVTISASSVKSFLGLSDEDVAKVTGLKVSVVIKNDKVLKTEIKYNVSGKAVTQTLDYLY